MDEVIGWVFGYGSLVAVEEAEFLVGGKVAQLGTLANWRRGWNVAMDNASAASDTKHFVDPDTGHRPAIFVAWLNVYACPGARVNGVFLPVTAAALAALDARERNYRRVEVSADTSLASPLPIWTFTGLAAGLKRFRVGQATGTLVVSSDYHELCLAAFLSRGQMFADTFGDSTDPLPAPLRRLILVRT
ncbi:MAG: hypothetical protein QG671_3695 [Actinomycetota bacterium]|nr:hypothetical protein [Actinomycetota bacterium]